MERRKITFKLHDRYENKEELQKIRKKLREQINKEIEEKRLYKEYLEDLKRKERVWEERINKVDEKVEELARWTNEKIESIEKGRTDVL